MGVTIRRRKTLIIHILCPVLTSILAFFFMKTFYKPDKLQLFATDQDQTWVTSTTPNADTNNFVDSTSGFNTHLNLRNCTLLESFWIGLVKEDISGNTEGYDVLIAAFDELNEAYKTANVADGFELKKKEFQNSNDLEDYIKRAQYSFGEKICFALAWDQFLPSENRFVIDLRWNFADTWETRKPQTLYEESLQNQLFLPEYAQTGFLQTMTTITNQIIKKMYNKEDYAFQLMYMPMNSKPFYNDHFSEVIGALIPLAIYTACKLASRVISFTGDFDEKRIQEKLQRLGMRKSVEFWLETFLTCFFMLIFIPLLCWMGTTYLIKTTSFWFFAVNMAIFGLNTTILSHMLKFLIDSHIIAEGMHIFIELLQIGLTAYGYFLVEINPLYVLSTSFLLPLPHISWVVTLAEIAKNDGIEVQLFQSNPIVHGNDLTTIMRIALLSLVIKVMILAYVWPIKISNDAKENRGCCYPCTRRFWRGCCKRDQQQQQRSVLTESYNKATLADSVSDERKKSKRVSLSAFRPMDQVFSELAELISDVSDGEDGTLKLDGVTVEHNKHHVVDDLTLTVNKNEIFVFVGENGSGKSVVLQTIAGLTHVRSGTATAFGVDLFKSLRYTQDNFLSIALQNEALIDNLTPEEQIKFCCRFMGIEDIQTTLEDILTQFNLKLCSNIITRRCSNVQRKSLSLALSLIGHSKIVLLDEPTAGMDISSKREIWELIRAHKKNRIIIVATQDMQEANTLGTRIGLLCDGKLTLSATPDEFAKEFNHTLQLVFKLKRRKHKQDKDDDYDDLEEDHLGETKEEQKEQLVKAVQEAILPAFRDKFTKEDIKWNSLGKLVVRLPLEARLNDCINMNNLHALQAIYFESVQVMKTPLDETFAQMAQPSINEDLVSLLSFSTQHVSLETNADLDSSALNVNLCDKVAPYSQTAKITYYESFTALLKTEFYWTNIWRQMVLIFLVSFLFLSQETFFVYFYLNVNRPIRNYNNIEETFEKAGAPILAFSNSFLPNSLPLQSTEALTSLYIQTVNVEVDQVIMEELKIPGQDLSVSGWLSEAAIMYQEAAKSYEQPHEVTALRRLSSSESGKKEAYGAYYIYQMDEVTNTYSIGVYGNQIAAASSPTFGATMLNALAQKITGEKTLQIEFRNNQLPLNATMFPSLKPDLAELFGVSLVAAMVWLMDLQIKWFGRPIHSGFYEAYLLKGGYPRAYLCSKYLKAVWSNLVMVVVLLLLFYCTKLFLFSTSIVAFFWCFINPLFVLGLSSLWIISFEMDYRFSNQRINLLAVGTGIIAYFSAGAIAHSRQSQGFLSQIEVLLFVPPTILFEAVEFGFLDRLKSIHENQDKTSIELSPWSKGSFFFYELKILAGNAAIWGTLFFFSTYGFSFLFRRRFKKVRPLESLDATNTALDVIKEAKQVDFIRKQERNDDHILTVQNLQCWKFLQWNEVGGVLKNNRSVTVVNKYLIGAYTVRGVSFSVKKLERVVLLGGSSSGASPLIQSLLGVNMILEGEVVINGWSQEIGQRMIKIDYTKLHGIVGYQPQRDSIDDELTVIQHLKLFSKLAGISRAERYREVDAILEACCLEDLKDIKAEALTPGQMKRLSLGMALIGRPRLLILDNPLAGVDPITKKKLISTILKWTEGRSLLMATRDVDEADLIGDKIAIMHYGKLLAVGSVGEIIESHGQGYSLDVQVDMKKINKQVSMIKTRERTTMRDEAKDDQAEAKDMLERIVEVLDRNQELRWPGLQEEFSKNGLLKNMFKEIDRYTVDKFINRILIFNLAFNLIETILVDNPDFELNIDFVYSDTLRISVKAAKFSFNLADFTAYLDSLVKDRPISSFTVNPNTMETVFQRFMQSTHFEAEKIKKAILKNYGQKHSLQRYIDSNHHEPKLLKRSTVIRPRTSKLIQKKGPKLLLFKEDESSSSSSSSPLQSPRGAQSFLTIN